MPSSIYDNIAPVLKYVTGKRVAPKRVLDIGVGFGKWGQLLREYLDVYKMRIQPGEWETIIEGIEIHEPYIMGHQRQIYDNIHIGAAHKIIENAIVYDGAYWDLVIACDVLEHMSRLQVLNLIGMITSRATTFIISVPLGEGWLGTGKKILAVNKFEEHISAWTREDFVSIGFKEIHRTQHPRGPIGLFVWES